MTLTSALNEAAGTTGLEAQGAANILAGTTGLSLVGALNVLAGNSYGGFKDLQGVVNQLNQTYGWGVDAASVSAGSWGAFDPASISGLTGWWDASDTGTITDTGGYVTQLNDLSGNANHLYQTGTYGPITGTRTQNGLNVLDFFATTRAALYSGAFVQSQPCTIFVVTQTDTLTVDSFGRSCIIGWSGVTGYNGCGITQAGAAGQIQLYAGVAFYTYHYLPVNTATQLTAVFGNGSSDVYLNGIIGTTLPPGTEGWGNGSRLMLGNAVDENVGGKFSINAAFNGWIGEVLVYDGALSSGDRATIEEYLKAKWGTP